jgi:hypothetical protein
VFATTSDANGAEGEAPDPSEDAPDRAESALHAARKATKIAVSGKYRKNWARKIKSPRRRGFAVEFAQEKTG